MQNIITLENLNDTLGLVKEYVDEHTSSTGTGSSDFMPIYGKLVKNTKDYYDQPYQKLYIGVPTGTDLNDIDLKFYRLCKVRERNKADNEKYKYKGLHEIWAIPQKNKVPLIVPIFKDKTQYDFQQNNYDYYEITAGEYDTFVEYCRDETTGYFNEGGDDLYIGNILKNKRNYICLVKDDNIISNFISINTQEDPNNHLWNLKI